MSRVALPLGKRCLFCCLAPFSLASWAFCEGGRLRPLAPFPRGSGRRGKNPDRRPRRPPTSRTPRAHVLRLREAVGHVAARDGGARRQRGRRASERSGSRSPVHDDRGAHAEGGARLLGREGRGGTGEEGESELHWVTKGLRDGRDGAGLQLLRVRSRVPAMTTIRYGAPTLQTSPSSRWLPARPRRCGASCSRRCSPSPARRTTTRRRNRTRTSRMSCWLTKCLASPARTHQVFRKVSRSHGWPL